MTYRPEIHDPCDQVLNGFDSRASTRRTSASYKYLCYTVKASIRTQIQIVWKITVTEMMRKMNNRVVVHMYMCLGVVAAHTIASQLAEIHSRSSICLELYTDHI